MTIAAAVPLAVRQLDSRHLAMGLALPYLSARQPFAAFPAGDLTRTVAGQILRGHYLMAFDGSRLVGYLGWAHYDRADALAFARSLRPPPEDRAKGRDVVWVMTMAATTGPALDALVLEGRGRHDGWRAMGLRHKRNGGVVVFDKLIRLRRSEAAMLAGR